MDTVIAVVFRKEDYAGLWRRLLVDLLDAIVVGFIGLAVFLALGGLIPKNVLMTLWGAALFGYFVLLKRSRFRTIGYRVARVKVVGFDGRRPGLWPLTLRLSFMAFGPLNYVFDVLWLSSDPHRQALRDKVAQTYVVRSAAEPAGAGKLIYRYYDIFGYNFLFREIEP